MLARRRAAPRLPYVILRAGLRLVLALSWLLVVTSARADDARAGASARIARRAPELSLFARRMPSPPAAGGPWLSGARDAGRGPRRPPICAGDVCQPRVAVPGLEPSFRGGRTDAVLAMLAGVPFPAVSKVARTISNVRVDYSPAGAAGERGWGKLVVSLRWRIDASGAPAR